MPEESIQEPITLYHLGDQWWDLCAGPHVENTSEINPKAIALESVAGAYWRGDENTESDKYIGSDEGWEKAKNAIRRAVTQLGMDYFEAPGEAAFYGPKLDFIFQDALEREWKLGTVQVDYNLPERFELEYVAEEL